MTEPVPEQGTLLVVDDNANNRDILKRHIERQGFRVKLASNGRLALEMLAQQPFDLVLLDLMMPELDGFEVLQRMKASPTLNSTPVIMISAL
ncbi:MAG: response regulator, partial [Acidobacteriota bacterium]|nr:response regulator [Acidobacteriota bacterium]